MRPGQEGGRGTGVRVLFGGNSLRAEPGSARGALTREHENVEELNLSELHCPHLQRGTVMSHLQAVMMII